MPALVARAVPPADPAPAPMDGARNRPPPSPRVTRAAAFGRGAWPPVHTGSPRSITVRKNRWSASRSYASWRLDPPGSGNGHVDRGGVVGEADFLERLVRV